MGLLNHLLLVCQLPSSCPILMSCPMQVLCHQQLQRPDQPAWLA
jgi:hypothetical protein